ncbi:MAG: beta-lactamase family protein, partial [Opitutaceae bacterium]|nr:beta-lactamase family protein [Opitutaceae bacterium]
MRSLRSLRQALCLLTLCAITAPAGEYAGIIAPYTANNSLAGAVFCVADNRKILACEAAGLADIASNRPMRPDDLFWIASMTKSFTALAIMTLVEDGKLSL